MSTFDDLRACLFVAVDAAIELRVPTLERAIRKLINMECDHCGQDTSVKQLRRRASRGEGWREEERERCEMSKVISDQWMAMKDQRGPDGLLTPLAMALDAIEDSGCDCGEGEEGSCLACLCDAALIDLWEQAGKLVRGADAGGAVVKERPRPARAQRRGPRTASTQRAANALMNVWRGLRDDASPTALASACALAWFAYDAGIVDSEQRELWALRFQTCPGHDDEGGRTWCAYCGDMMNGGPR